VVDEVVELALASCVLGVQPAACADRVEVRLAGLVVDQGVAPDLLVAVACEREERDPVFEPARPRVRRVEDRRRVVDVRDELRPVDAVRDPRAAHEQRHADRRLVDPRLAVDDAVLAVEEAVVGGEEDQRVVELAGLAQRLDDRADGVVDREERLPALLPVLPDRRDLALVEQRAATDEERLVGDVGLVETRAASAAARSRRRLGSAAQATAMNGSSGSAGWPSCGARNATQRKNGCGSGARRRMISSALSRKEVGLVAGRLPVLAVGRQLPVLVLLAEEDRVVAGVLEPDSQRVRRVELVVAAERGAFPRAPWLCGYWPVSSDARDGQQSEKVTKLLSKVTPSSPIRRRTVGSTAISASVWSSVSRTRTFRRSRAAIACARA
jgi:hypothetical protein